MPHFKLALEEPRHGWLRVQASSESGTVEFIASDVPNNPVQDLVSAVGLALREEESSVWWNLEPDGYYFEFTPFESNIHFCISFAHNSARDRRQEVLSLVGTKQEVLLPIWRALRRFESLDTREPHWPPGEYSQLISIGNSLHAQSAA